MSAMFDPYEELGVSRNATEAQIRAAQKELAQLLHPDAGGRQLTPEQRERRTRKTARVNQAAQILLDPQKRQAIDEALARAHSSTVRPPPSQGEGAGAGRREAGPGEVESLKEMLRAAEARRKRLTKALRKQPGDERLRDERHQCDELIGHLRERLELAEKGASVSRRTDPDCPLSWRDHMVPLQTIVARLVKQGGRLSRRGALRAALRWLRGDPVSLGAGMVLSAWVAHFVVAPFINLDLNVVNGFGPSFAYLLIPAMAAIHSLLMGRQCHGPWELTTTFAGRAVGAVILLAEVTFFGPIVIAGTLGLAANAIFGNPIGWPVFTVAAVIGLALQAVARGHAVGGSTRVTADRRG